MPKGKQKQMFKSHYFELIEKIIKDLQKCNPIEFELFDTDLINEFLKKIPKPNLSYYIGNIYAKKSEESDKLDSIMYSIINQRINNLFDKIRKFNLILEKIKNYKVDKNMKFEDAITLYENFEIYSNNIELELKKLYDKYKLEYNRFYSIKPQFYILEIFRERNYYKILYLQIEKEYIEQSSEKIKNDYDKFRIKAKQLLLDNLYNYDYYYDYDNFLIPKESSMQKYRREYEDKKREEEKLKKQKDAKEFQDCIDFFEAKFSFDELKHDKI